MLTILPTDVDTIAIVEDEVVVLLNDDEELRVPFSAVSADDVKEPAADAAEGEAVIYDEDTEDHQNADAADGDIVSPDAETDDKESANDDVVELEIDAAYRRVLEPVENGIGIIIPTWVAHEVGDLDVVETLAVHGITEHVVQPEETTSYDTVEGDDSSDEDVVPSDVDDDIQANADDNTDITATSHEHISTDAQAFEPLTSVPGATDLERSAWHSLVSQRKLLLKTA